MILVGNQRGGAKNLAQHLLKQENEHVEVHELRGFASESLPGALNEAYAISRGTRCKQFLFSLSLNPPQQENVSTEIFETAINRIEDQLGLTGQPRAIVFHEKEGRRHCHTVWSRIKADEMKAVQLSYSHRKLQQISRELFIEHGWQMPRGLMVSKERDLRNFTLAEWQQAKRIGKDPREIKTVLQDCWAIADSRQAFAAALEERGYKLARGDRRSFVAVDTHGEIYAVAKWVGVKTKSVRARLGNESDLPSVAQRKQEFSEQIAARLNELKTQQDVLHAQRLTNIEDERKALVERQRQNRVFLAERQTIRREKEVAVRQERYNRGLKGLLDRLTGKHKRIKAQNEAETYQANIRDRTEKDTLIFRQLEERRGLQRRIVFLRSEHKAHTHELKQDISHYDKIKHQGLADRLKELREAREKNEVPERPRTRHRTRQRGQDYGPER